MIDLINHLPKYSLTISLVATLVVLSGSLDTLSFPSNSKAGWIRRPWQAVELNRMRSADRPMSPTLKIVAGSHVVGGCQRRGTPGGMG